MSRSVHDMTDREYAEYLLRLQQTLNTALNVARHVHIEKSSLDDEDRDYIDAEYMRLLAAVSETLTEHTTAGLDYRVDYPPIEDELPVGFSVCVRIKLEIIPEPLTDEELDQAPRALEDLP